MSNIKVAVLCISMYEGEWGASIQENIDDSRLLDLLTGEDGHPINEVFTVEEGMADSTHLCQEDQDEIRAVVDEFMAFPGGFEVTCGASEGAYYMKFYCTVDELKAAIAHAAHGEEEWMEYFKETALAEQLGMK